MKSPLVAPCAFGFILRGFETRTTNRTDYQIARRAIRAALFMANSYDSAPAAAVAHAKLRAELERRRAPDVVFRLFITGKQRPGLPEVI